MSAGMANYVKDVQPERVLMMTECSMSENVSAENPNVDFVKPCNLCPHMKRITLDNILTSLETLQPRVAVERMVAVG
jgi:quinolinate synthase